MSESDEEPERLVNQDPNFEEDFGGKEWPFSGKGGPDEIPVPKGAACVKINDVLGGLSEKFRDFSFGGQADQLPAVPGIFVDGVGPIPVPLWEERAQRLIEMCEKFPFGHNMDTKMDENVRKSWELQPDHVQFRNPMWKAGMEKMAATIADRRGYNDIPVQCVLYKLLVYGEGGHFVKHQDTEKKDGMIATLVVQPPSLHEGGDLVVYRHGEVKHRHDFGKTDGTATYLPHYAVHYADAEHAVERVTKGYRLALVYSVCLPANMRHLGRSPKQRTMRGELAEAIETMTSEHDSFALLLAHEYTDRSIAGFGSRALKGVDRERFLALEEANCSVAAEKKLQFHIAKLHHHVNFYDIGSILGRYGVECHEEKVAWYTLGGESLGLGDEVKLTFNFLNPAMETQSQFWQKPYGSSDSNGYLGNEGPEKDSVYSRFAIVAWPAVDNVEFTMKFANLGTAFETLRDQRPVDTATLVKLMDIAITKLADIDIFLAERRKLDIWNGSYTFPPLISTATCQVLCQLLQETGNSTLVSVFFSNFLSRLKDKHAIVLDIAKLVRKFAWGVIGKALLEALICVDWRQQVTYVMETTLAVAGALERGQAQQSLLSFAVGKAESLPDDCLISSRSLEELWRLVLSNGDDGMLTTLSRKFERMNPRLSAQAVKIFSRYLRDSHLPEERRALLVAIISCRIEWLKKKVRVLEKPFSWEMPVAEFPDCGQIEEFLHGSEATMTTTGIRSFNDTWEARTYALVHACDGARVDELNASFAMEAIGENSDAFVKITKTQTWYDKNQENVPHLKEELNGLMDATVGTLVQIISKKGWARQKLLQK